MADGDAASAPAQAIYCADARERVAPETGGWDVLITDPPYSRHTHENATTTTTQPATPGYVQKNDLGFGHLSPSFRRWVARVAAASRRWSVIYSDVENSTWMRLSCEAAGAEYVRTWPWVRWSMPQLTGDRPTQGFEHVMLFHAMSIGPRGGRKPIAKRWTGPGDLTHLSHLALRDNEKHKCEKPLDQALDLVSWFSEPGECVLDVCAGAGIVGVACAVLGRDFVGFEQQETWAEYGNRLLTGPGAWKKRHRDRLASWVGKTREAAQRVLDEPQFTEPSRARARKRLEDAARAAEYAQ